MEAVQFEKISLDQLPVNTGNKNKIELFLLRLDKIHAEISGNKWFKLKFYLDDAIDRNRQTIVTYGGAWSNHILATAAACKLKGLQSIGIIRGEKPQHLSYTLIKAMEYGMKLIFISRDDYKQKIMPPELINTNNNYYIINEGGYGEKGAAGAASIAVYYQNEPFTHICCAVGTGTMMAGLISAATPDQEVTGISVLKNNFSIEKEVEALLPVNKELKKYSIHHNYHFDGYAKTSPLLIDFMNTFYSQTNIPTDFVYTGKLIYGVYDLVTKNFFKPGSRILIIHSGGLQGNNSLPPGTLIF